MKEFLRSFHKFFQSRQFLRLLPGPLFFLLIELFRVLVVSPTGIYEEDMISWYIHKLAFAALLLPCITLFSGRLRKLFNWGAIILSPAVSFYILEYFVRSPHLLSAQAIFLNLLFFYLLAVLLISLIGRTDISLTIITVFSAGYGLINFYVNQFRNSSILPWDLASIGIASRIAGGYNYTICPRIGLSLTLAVLLVYINIVCRENIKRPRKPLRLLSALASLAVMVGMTFFLQAPTAVKSFKLTENYFDSTEMYRKNGSVVSFLMNLHFVFPDVPENYSAADLKRLDAQYKPSGSTADDSAPENIIVIMNESLTDLSVISDFETNKDPMPFLNSLKETGHVGRLHTSVRGGNTCNTEFEFFTGMTMSFLPAGCIPYQQYIHNEYPNLVSNLSQLGYKTAAMHPADAINWRRDTVYKFFGFEQMYFYEFFTDAETYRNFVSDKGMYEKLLNVIEDNKDPLFLFGITMQNHGGYYDNKDLPLEVFVNGMEDDIDSSTFLTLMHKSDSALEWLLEQLENSDERTLVLMFGDHQPGGGIAENIESLYGSVSGPGTAEYTERFYTTPYVVWANYDMDMDFPEDFSVNYLSTLLMDICGLPKTRFQDFMTELYSEYPVISPRGFIDSEGSLLPPELYSSVPMLNDYACLQYNYLFDNPIENFWNY